MGATALGLVLVACSSGGGSSKAGTTSTSRPNQIFGRDVPPPVVSTTTPMAPAGTIANGDFEAGLDGWASVPAPATPAVADREAHSGTGSALTPLRYESEQEGGAASVLLQDLDAAQLPRTISGWYRVDNWAPTDNIQFVSLAIAAIDPKRTPKTGTTNVQLHYLLGGTAKAPFRIDNAKFVFVTRNAPPVGTWTRFEIHPREDFARMWGSAPRGMRFVRLILTNRVTTHAAGEPAGGADVRWDDLAIDG